MRIDGVGGRQRHPGRGHGDGELPLRPDRSPEAALTHVREVFDGLDVHLEQTDAVSGALPGWLHRPPPRLVEAADGMVRAKYG